MLAKREIKKHAGEKWVGAQGMGKAVESEVRDRENGGLTTPQPFFLASQGARRAREKPINYDPPAKNHPGQEMGDRWEGPWKS